MNQVDEFFEQFYGALKDAYDRNGHNHVSQEELDKTKSAPGEGSLGVAKSQGGLGTPMRMPPVRPPIDNRRGRRAAEEEQMRRAAIVWKADRTALADESVAAVAVHANRTGDRMRNAITDDFYGEKRPEAMNELARRFAARCIALGEAGILAIAEGHPARVAEDL